MLFFIYSLLIGSDICSHLKSPSALRTILEVLLCLKTTVAAAFKPAAMTCLHFRQMFRPNLHILPTGNGFADLRIQCIHRVAACALHKVLLIPFEAGNEEQRQAHVSHKDPVTSIGAAVITYDHLIIIKIFSARGNSHHEKHSSYSYLYHIRQAYPEIRENACRDLIFIRTVKKLPPY
jgi:hypothetical protein